MQINTKNISIGKVFLFDICKNVINQSFIEIQRNSSKVPNITTIVLTGSFSRDEGSVLSLSTGKTLVLGDLEFIVITKEATDLALSANVLDQVARKAEASLREQDIHCSIELSPVARNFLKRAKPSIFNYELYSNGKVVFGEKDVMQEMPAITASQIPRIDAFYLLCNRIVEQLSHFLNLTASPLSSNDAYYPMVKLYMDMAGSFLILTDRYEPTYRKRCDVFADLDANEAFLGEDHFPLFLSRLQEMTSFKLNPDVSSLPAADGLDDFFIDLFFEGRGFARQLWLWEVDKLSGSGGRIAMEESFSAIMKQYSLKAWIRGWLKFLRIAWRIREPLPYWKLARLVVKGPPQMLIYCAAARLYFSLNREGESNVKEAMSFLPTRAAAGTSREAMAAVVDAWKKFIKSV